jgi:two-component system response regulator YesN
MYKVFLADDEIVVREGIRNNFPWENSEFVLTGEAPDGEIALSMLQDIKPDILITDIRMPFMDGLALCRSVVHTMPWMHVVILSGYDEFAYAKEAMALGIKEYILKPVNAQELLQTLLRIAEDLEGERKKQEDLAVLKEQFASSNRLLHENILRELLGGSVKQEEIEGFLNRSRKLHMSFLAPWYLVILIIPGYTDKRYEESIAVQGTLQRLCDGSGGTICFCEMIGYPVILVMGDNERDLEERAYGVAQAAEYGIGRTPGIPAKVSIGSAVNHLWEVPQSLSTAQMVQRTMGVFQKENSQRRIIGVRDVGIMPGLSFINLDVKPIGEQLQYATKEDVDDILTRYVASIGDMAVRSMVMANFVYVEILLAASRIIKENGGIPNEVIPNQLQEQGISGSMRSVDDALPLTKEILLCAIAFRDRQNAMKYSMVIRKAQAYLNAQYTNPGISLHDVASYVALSNNHFCTVFSQEVGITFTEYLTGLRINKAKELLRSTNLRSSDIAYQIGYNDPHYFSYLFRKTTGMTPGNYRGKNQVNT